MSADGVLFSVNISYDTKKQFQPIPNQKILDAW